MKKFLKKLLIGLLMLEARAVVKRCKPHIVAVTGSVGKTSTKDAIYSVIAMGSYVRKSEKSFNGDIGLPLTILGQPNPWNNPLRWIENVVDGLFLALSASRYPQWLVLEIGADRPGDIRRVAQWLRVDVAVITRLPEVPVHVEFFDSPEAVIEEKASLINALVPEGVLVLYGDDERAAEFARRVGHKKVSTFGFSSSCDVRVEDFKILFEEGVERWPIGMSARIRIRGSSAPVEIVGTLGSHAMLPALAAAAVGDAVGRSLPDIVGALKSYEPPPGRMHLIEGVKNSLIIDDTYNSSPAAVVAALDTLVLAAPRGRKIAVLGDMLELGRHSVEEHRKIGAHVAKTSDLLVTIGFRARDIVAGALDGGFSEQNILQFENAERAGEELEELVVPGDCILVKGSQSMRMERTVLELMAYPERAEQLLVRQDAEWRKR